MVMRRKVKRVGKVSNGVVHIQITHNNVIVAITDAPGNTLVTSSGGRYFKGPRKCTPHALQFVLDAASREARNTYSLRTVSIVLTGPACNNMGQHAVRGIDAAGLIISEISSVPSYPHGGCRRKRKRSV